MLHSTGQQLHAALVAQTMDAVFSDIRPTLRPGVTRPLVPSADTASRRKVVAIEGGLNKMFGPAATNKFAVLYPLRRRLCLAAKSGRLSRDRPPVRPRVKSIAHLHLIQKLSYGRLIKF